MRFNRTTLFLLLGSLGVILLAMLALNAPVSAPESTTPLASESPGGPIFADLDLAEITELTLTQAEGESLVLQQDAEGWRFNTPELAERSVDEALLQISLELLPQLRYSDQFEAQDLAAYGLDAPSFTLTLQQDETRQSLALGNLNPGETRYYGLLNEDPNQVYLLTPTTMLDSLKSLLANPPLLPLPTPVPEPVLNIPGAIFNDFDQRNLSRFTLFDVAGERLSLERDPQGQWQLSESTQDIEGEIDSLQVSALVDLFGFLRAVDAIEGANLEALGLTEPALSIEAETIDGRLYRVRVGNVDPSGTRVYALINDFDTVAVLNQADVAELLDLLLAPPLLPEAESSEGDAP